MVSDPNADAAPPTPRAVRAYLLGALDLDTLQAFQHRLVYDVAGEPGTAAVILCDHPPGVSVGRDGSRAHLRQTPEELEARGRPVRWVARGGGVTLHLPGQVACYPVLPLAALGLTPAGYVAALCDVLGDLLRGFGLAPVVGPDRPAVLLNGRPVATVGVAVRNGVASFGCVLNVNPELAEFKAYSCDGDPRPMTSVQRECPTRVRVPAVRQRLLDLLAERFRFDRVSVFHGHPTFLPRPTRHAVTARHRSA